MPLHTYFGGTAGEIKVGAIRRFLFFGSSSVPSTAAPEISPSRLASGAGVGVSGGVDNGGLDPVDEIDGFRFEAPPCEVMMVGWTKVDVGDGTERATGGIVEILGVDENGDTVVTEDEFERVGLAARKGGAGNDGVEMDGDGREIARDDMVAGAGPGCVSPSSPDSKMTVEQNPSVEVMISMLPSLDLSH